MTYLDYKEKEALRKQVAIRHLENGVSSSISTLRISTKRLPSVPAP